MTSGYRHPLYARALETWGASLELPASGGHVLVRPIAGSTAVDVQGCYPVLACATPDALPDDLRVLAAGVPAPIVTLSFVLDPLRDWPLGTLRTVLPVQRELGSHVVVEPRRWTETLSTHHRRAIERGRRHGMQIGPEADPLAFQPEWRRLYGALVSRAGITGHRTFSPAIFDAMARVPGTHIFSARLNGVVVGADWYFEDEPFVYAHLSAYAADGYAVGASYPMMAAALDFFATRPVAWLDIGGVPLNGAGDGLASFKAGWSPLRRPSLFLGAVLDRQRYAELSRTSEPADGAFFPAYRRREY